MLRAKGPRRQINLLTEVKKMFFGSFPFHLSSPKQFFPRNFVFYNNFVLSNLGSPF